MDVARILKRPTDKSLSPHPSRPPASTMRLLVARHDHLFGGGLGVRWRGCSSGRRSLRPVRPDANRNLLNYRPRVRRLLANNFVAPRPSPSPLKAQSRLNPREFLCTRMCLACLVLLMRRARHPYATGYFGAFFPPRCFRFGSPPFPSSVWELRAAFARSPPAPLPAATSSASVCASPPPPPSTPRASPPPPPPPSVARPACPRGTSGPPAGASSIHFAVPSSCGPGPQAPQSLAAADTANPQPALELV